MLRLDAAGVGRVLRLFPPAFEIAEDRAAARIVQRLDSIELGPSFEIEADKVFRDETMAYVWEEPGRWLMLGLHKIVMLWTIDPYYPRGLHAAYVIPTMLTSVMILWSLALIVLRMRRDRTMLDRLLPLVIVGVMLTLLFGLTYVQPRYQTYLFTALLPLTAILIDRLWFRSA